MFIVTSKNLRHNGVAEADNIRYLFTY